MDKKKTYRPYNPDQMLLFPPSLNDWLPENHLARFVGEVVDTFDIGEIERVYEDELRGYPPHHPRMMLKILIYGYCTGCIPHESSPRNARTKWPFGISQATIRRNSGPSLISGPVI